MRKNRKKKKGYKFAGESFGEVKPLLPNRDIRSLFKPCYSPLACKKEDFDNTYRKFNGAMDSMLASDSMQYVVESPFTMSLHAFAGYGYLQNLSQDAIIRLCIDTRTRQMTDKWIEVKCADEEKSQEIEKKMNELRVKDVFAKALSIMGFMGGCFIFIDDGTEPEKLINPMNFSDKSTLTDKQTDISFKVIDPIFCTPQSFNAVDPTANDFYKPSVFFIMGTPVHRSRLLRLAENEVVDMLKPAYNFFGIPQAQILADYAKHFRKNREETCRALEKFSTSVVKSQISKYLFNAEDRTDLYRRIEEMAKNRNNSGVILLDMDEEDFVQVNTPLSGLTDIVRQSLEHLVAVNQTGVVKTLGLSPAGFSATGESDLRMNADFISSHQEAVMRRPLQKVFDVIQLMLFGKIDESITFEFLPVIDEDMKLKADTNKAFAERDAILIAQGIISNDEARDRLRKTPDSDYEGIEGDAPEMPEADFAEIMTGEEEEEHEEGKTEV